MSPKESVLGPQDSRIKTDMRLPIGLMNQVERVCEELGIRKNAFFVIAAGFLIVKLSPLLPLGPRKKSVDAIQTLFQSLLKELRKSS